MNTDRDLIGALVALALALAYIVKLKTNGHNKHDLRDEVLEAERRIHQNINDTRHSLANGIMKAHGDIITEVRRHD